MKGPVRVVLVMSVRRERTEEFERAWRKAASWVRSQPGCLRQSLCRTDEDYVLSSDWADEETFRRFERSPEQDDMTADLRRLRESSRMEVQRILHHY
ncbi:antibiotic biosynthesis monooxygenase family protein [Nonomuraea typhae]|uniref:Antibiotic biosynthesis monooxygenase family protein n=1 Tax=Nonomuraea typhae TaxID=2603600 RepID=A0ABW7YMA6_9ACTN